MRTENSLKNTIWTILAFVVNFVVNFVARKIFIDILGAEYNGLNSLLTSIISVLSIAELGIGTTIIYFLYEPLHKKDEKLIKSLLRYYRNCYRVIASVVFGIGLIIIPFLPMIVGELSMDVNLYVVYLLFLLESVFSYLLSYKRSIIVADQKDRITKYVHIAIILLTNVIQIISLYLTKNYYIFLFIRMVFVCLENIILALIANKKYPYIVGKAEVLPTKVKASLMKKIRAMIYHQIGGFVVNGTDNIMISMMFGISQVGVYNNYFLVVSSAFNLINGIFSGITASVGNLLVAKNIRSSLDAYRGIQAIGFITAAFVACAFYVCIQPLVKIWIGEEYLMSELVVGTLSVYLYFKVMKLPINAFKNAAGIFYEDRFVPIVESIVNIVASLVCANIFGISGIIMGTIISTMVLYFGSYPLIVYKLVFKKSSIHYYNQHLLYLLSMVLIVAIVVLMTKVIVVQNPLVEILKNMLITVFVFALVFIVLWYSNSSFHFIAKNIFKKFFRKKKKNS